MKNRFYAFLKNGALSRFKNSQIRLIMWKLCRKYRTSLFCVRFMFAAYGNLPKLTNDSPT